MEALPLQHLGSVITPAVWKLYHSSSMEALPLQLHGSVTTPAPWKRYPFLFTTFFHSHPASSFETCNFGRSTLFAFNVMVYFTRSRECDPGLLLLLWSQSRTLGRTFVNHTSSRSTLGTIPLHRTHRSQSLAISITLLGNVSQFSLLGGLQRGVARSAKCICEPCTNEFLEPRTNEFLGFHRFIVSAYRFNCTARWISPHWGIEDGWVGGRRRNVTKKRFLGVKPCASSVRGYNSNEISNWSINQYVQQNEREIEWEGEREWVTPHPPKKKGERERECRWVGACVRACVCERARNACVFVWGRASTFTTEEKNHHYHACR